MIKICVWKSQNKLQASVSELDIGNDDENLGELCEWVYLPRSSNQKQSQNPYIRATLEWTRNEEYIKSIEWHLDNVCAFVVGLQKRGAELSNVVHPWVQPISGKDHMKIGFLMQIFYSHKNPHK